MTARPSGSESDRSDIRNVVASPDDPLVQPVRIDLLPHEPDAETIDPPADVLSVSPSRALKHDQDDGHESNDVSGQSQEPASHDVFIAPRVIDQHAFDELARLLRGLVDDADHAIERLHHVMNGEATQRAVIEHCAAQVQDRLRLGARMLKAFNAQIDRVESQLQTLQQDSDALAQTQTAVRKLQQSFEARCREQYESTLSELEEEVNDRLRAKLGRLNDLEQRIVACEEKATAAEAAADRAAARIDQQTRTLKQVEASARRAVREAKSATEQCTNARSMLQAELRGTADAIDALADRAHATVHEVRGSMEVMNVRVADAQKRLKSLNAAMRKAGDLTEHCERVDKVIEKLKPWMTAGDDPDTLPEPVQRMLKHVRSTVASDLNRFTSLMRDIAGNVDASMPNDE